MTVNACVHRVGSSFVEVLSCALCTSMTMMCCACVQLYELGAECGENEGDGDVVPVCLYAAL